MRCNLSTPKPRSYRRIEPLCRKTTLRSPKNSRSETYAVCKKTREIFFVNFLPKNCRPCVLSSSLLASFPLTRARGFGRFSLPGRRCSAKTISTTEGRDLSSHQRDGSVTKSDVLVLCVLLLLVFPLTAGTEGPNRRLVVYAHHHFFLPRERRGRTRGHSRECTYIRVRGKLSPHGRPRVGFSCEKMTWSRASRQFQTAESRSSFAKKRQACFSLHKRRRRWWCNHMSSCGVELGFKTPFNSAPLRRASHTFVPKHWPSTSSTPPPLAHHILACANVTDWLSPVLEPFLETSVFLSKDVKPQGGVLLS